MGEAAALWIRGGELLQPLHLTSKISEEFVRAGFRFF